MFPTLLFANEKERTEITDLLVSELTEFLKTCTGDYYDFHSDMQLNVHSVEPSCH